MAHLPSACHPTQLRWAWPLARSARDVAYALDAGDDTLALRLKLWLDEAFALARSITTLVPSTVTTKRRKLERSLDDLLAAPAVSDLARRIQNRMRRARYQLLTFAFFPGKIEAHNNACERDLRPAVIQRKNTNGYRTFSTGARLASDADQPSSAPPG
jgi:transposase